MSDLKQDLAKKFLNYLDNKQYKRLQFEAEMIGNIDDQHPVIKFYYASSIYLDDTSKDKELLYASKLYKEVFLSNKKNIQSLYNMIAVSFKTKVFRDVMPLALKAYEKNQKDVKLIEGLARINFYLGNRKESRRLFLLLYEILPEKTEGRLPFISSLNYMSGVSQKDYMKDCQNYSSLIEKKFNVKMDNNKFDWKKNDKIKISFLSGDFRTHSVSHFFKEILNKLDKSFFEIHLISNLKITDHDNLTSDLKKLSDKWYDVEHYSDDDLVTLLRSLNFDILIDLCGLTSGNRYEVLAQKCAKIQIEWLGYNNSLCLKNVDYLISDKNLIKPDELNMYKEKILFLPKIWNALPAPEILPEIANKKNILDDNFTFCSFNNFQKLSDRTIDVWSRLLIKTKSKLLLKNSLIGGDDLKNNVLNKFTKLGVKREQLVFLEREKNIDDHLKIYNKANVALDTFPYPGVTTSFEALLMGVPVLTMKGFNMNSRCGESINKNIKMDHLIADDEEDYIKKAIFLIEEKNNPEIYGIKLREKALSSPLFDTETFVKDFEHLLKEVIIND